MPLRDKFLKAFRLYNYIIKNLKNQVDKKYFTNKYSINNIICQVLDNIFYYR